MNAALMVALVGNAPAAVRHDFGGARRLVVISVVEIDDAYLPR